MSELGQNPPHGVNKYIKEYAGRLGLELRDPPEHGWQERPKLLGRLSITDGVPIVTENVPEDKE